jgi:hypothetical protein
MTRTKGSKNKPKFEQLSFEVPNAIGGGTVELVDISDQIYANQRLNQYEVTNTMEITHSLQMINQGNFATVNEDLKVRFFDKGWRLFNTHFAGLQEGSMLIVYIFIRETSAS